MWNMVKQQQPDDNNAPLVSAFMKAPSLSRGFVALSPVNVLRFASSLIMLFSTFIFDSMSPFCNSCAQQFWGHWRFSIFQLQHLPLHRVISNFSVIQNPPSSLITHSDSAGQRLALELPCLFIFNLSYPGKHQPMSLPWRKVSLEEDSETSQISSAYLYV